MSCTSLRTTTLVRIFSLQYYNFFFSFCSVCCSVVCCHVPFALSVFIMFSNDISLSTTWHLLSCPAAVYVKCVYARVMLQQPIQNHPSRYRGGWATLWLAEEMRNRQQQRMDIPAHARTAQRATCRKDWKRVSAESSLMSPQWPSWSRDWTEMNYLELVDFVEQEL